MPSRTDAILDAVRVALDRTRAVLDDDGAGLRTVRVTVHVARGSGRPRTVVVAMEREIVTDRRPGRAADAVGGRINPTREQSR